MLIAGLLLAGAVLATRLSNRLGVPALLLFLAVGMLAGEDGPLGLQFDDAGATWTLGVVTLIWLLFAGGLDTDFEKVRPAFGPAMALATAGVAISAGLVAAFHTLVLGGPWTEGLLLGAIVSSTDAAAVFSVFRQARLDVVGRIRPTLELESGSNDPMAIFLVTVFTAYAVGNPLGAGGVALGFVVQMGVGLVAGWAGGRAIAAVMNRVHLTQEGLYPVLSVALVAMLFAGASLAGGNGFLAVYVGGLVLGTRRFVHRTWTVRFHDALAWLSQIVMFLVLGLLVTPSRLPEVAGDGLLLAGWLMLVARPVSVAVALLPFGVPWREQAMIAWVGLRGAVPIILATFPRMAGVEGAQRLFDLVFFAVVASVLAQGATLPWVARRLGVATPMRPDEPPEDEFARAVPPGSELVRATVGGGAAGRTLVDLALPTGALVVLVRRGERYLIPQGGTALETGDRVLAVAESSRAADVRALLTGRDHPSGGGDPAHD